MVFIVNPIYPCVYTLYLASEHVEHQLVQLAGQWDLNRRDNCVPSNESLGFSDNSVVYEMY